MNKIRDKKNIYTDLIASIQKNEPVAIATVVESSGSTPQGAGSSAIFNNNGLVAGTIGGGKVEYKIQQEAISALNSGKSGHYRFELKDDITEPDSAICGGGMSVLLDAEPQRHSEAFNSLLKDYSKRIPGVLVTLANSEVSGELKLERIWATRKNFEQIKHEFQPDVAKTVSEMLDKNKFGDFREIVIHTSPEFEDNYAFLEAVVPLPQLIIAGAGHVGKALAHQGKLLDFEIIVWDDRKEFANKDNFQEADKVLSGKLDDSLGQFKVGNDSFIVIVTRGHSQDADVLKQFINTEAGYIGMIGSRKKIAQVKEKSLQEGWATSEQWEKIHAPIGLNIHSKTIEEIAISIAAELIQERYNLNNRNG